MKRFLIFFSCLEIFFLVNVTFDVSIDGNYSCIVSWTRCRENYQKILKTNLTVLKLHSSWWLNSHNKHYKFSSVCFSLPLGQIIVIDNLGPCVTDSRGETFLVIIMLRLCWCVAPLHFLLIRMFSSSESQRCVTSRG